MGVRVGTAGCGMRIYVEYLHPKAHLNLQSSFIQITSEVIHLPLRNHFPGKYLNSRFV